MKISVISPSFNQAQFLPDNLRTVAGQRGVAVEHIIVDPGSTDGSTDLARAATHAILLNEPDRGQSHGITKGFAMATGDVLVWLNSDDFYPAPDVLAKVAAAFARHPEADVIYGGVNFVDEAGAFLRKGFVNKDAKNLLRSFQYQVGIVQPGMFMRRRVFEAVGGPSEDYNYCMDYEYWVRIAAAGFKWVYLDETLAHHRWWPGMKTSSGRGDSLIEHFKVGLTYFGYIHHKWLDRYGEFVATKSDGVVNHAAAGSVDAGAKAAAVRRAIDRFATQDMMARIDRARARVAAGQTGGEENGAQDTEMAATADYIARIHPGFRRVLYEPADLPGAVSTHPDPQAKQRVAWRIFDTTVPQGPLAGRAFKTYEVPNNFTRHFDADWYHDERERALERLTRLQRRRKESCVIVANGPSLNRSNLDLLRHADVIISNFAIISKPLREAATYLTIVNDLVAKQGSVQFNRLDIPKLVPFWLGNSINAGDSTVFLPATVEPVFCGTLDGTFSWRSTVSFLNMQLAFAMGYENVVLIGFDHSYQQAPDLKEGAAIVQDTEDPNHFDPRYFHGKTWQAADTGNMEKMYLVAREAYAAAGRRIVNATDGGKLEVFAREPLDRALGLAPVRAPAAAAPAAAAPPPHPRTLVLDMTAAGDGSATGEIKANLFATWPDAAFLQVARAAGTGLSLVRRDGAGFAAAPADAAAIDAAVAAFDPAVILYRPVPDLPHLHSLAMRLIGRLNRPVAVWIMDDWPDRLATENPRQWAALGPDLNDLLRRSALRLSICDAMSGAFAARYGATFRPLANGIDPADWPGPRRHDGRRLLLRYAGGLAENMTQASVLRVARAVERLAAAGHDIRFEINTQTWWYDRCHRLFDGLRHTTIGKEMRPAADYRRWLSEADALLIAYNFDAATLRYVRYSMANKMPECLASGAAVFVHGPRNVATVDYLAGTGAAAIVDTEADDAVEAGLGALIGDPDRRTALAAAARALADDRHNVHRLRETLRASLQALADGWAEADGTLRPAFDQLRAEHAAMKAQVRSLEDRLAAAAAPRAAGGPLPDLPDGPDLTARLAAAPGTPAAARLLVMSCASGLLTDAPAMQARLAADAALQAALDRALAGLPAGDPLAAHFARARGHAAAQAAR